MPSSVPLQCCETKYHPILILLSLVVESIFIRLHNWRIYGPTYFEPYRKVLMCKLLGTVVASVLPCWWRRSCQFVDLRTCCCQSLLPLLRRFCCSCTFSRTVTCHKSLHMARLHCTPLFLKAPTKCSCWLTSGHVFAISVSLHCTSLHRVTYPNDVVHELKHDLVQLIA